MSVVGQSRTGRLALGLYALVFTVVTLAFFRRFPIPEFIPKLAALLSAVWFAYALHCIGRFARTIFAPPSHDAGVWSNRLTNGLLGFGLFSILVLFIGWVLPGDLQLKLRVVLGLMVAASAADWILMERRLAALRTPRWNVPALLMALPAAGAIASFISSFSPITHYDSLVYHLALPALYLRQGGIGAVPFNLYSLFPAATEMNFLFILGTLPAPEYTINLLGWLLAFGIGAALAEWCERLAGIESSWISIVLWWTAPLVLLLSQGAYVEIPLAAATFLALRWHVAGRRSGDLHSLALAGVFSGLAMSIKYTGAITIAILGIDLLILASRRKLSWRCLLLFAGGAVLCPAPWLLKNLLTVGNPVFPFFYRFLGGNVGWTRSTADGYFKMLTEYGAQSNVIADLFSGLWRDAATQGVRGGFDVLGDFGWPLILFGAPLGFIVGKEREEVRFLSAYALVHFAGWYLSKPVLRFLVSLFPLAVLLTTVALRGLTLERGRIVRWLTAALVIPWIASNVFIYGLAAGELRLFAVPFGKVSREEFLRQRLSFYPTFKNVSESLAPGERVLLIGEQRTYHLAAPFISSNLFAPSPIAALCNESDTPAAIMKGLQRIGVSFIVLSETEVERLGGLRRFGFTEAGETEFRHFLSEQTTLISADRGVLLYRLK